MKSSALAHSILEACSQDRCVRTIGYDVAIQVQTTEGVFLPRPPITPIEEMGHIPLSEVSDTPPPPISFSLNARLRAEVERRIDNVLGEPRGLNGKGKRTKLTLDQTHILKPALIEAVEHAHVWASRGPLANRVKGRGRPPDNAVFLFIDDLALALEGVSLKPSLRYVAGSESLLVRLFIELAPLLWGPVKAPRRLFERWQRWRPTLARE